ncbi:hypothetical protein [Pseudoalteromonas sp. SR41-6]|uniref:hypothetical protein n=1 Tax=Pseudoalteromonas sp. SR41-6 TaxID=2760948 RepID=UPI00160293E9|nr:hypothetical protein [Pseudoalteromonas sp. SR41-6]MBB1333993.1 hypothetical protein [Pseudoalteromonas sp. SR41-6]
MKKILLLAFTTYALSSSISFASILEKQDASIAYKVNNTSPWQHRKKLDISPELPSLSWNMGSDCSGFDAGISVEGMMNDAKSQFNKLQRDAVNALKGFVTQLPMLAIQRMDPGLYELISNGIIKGEDIFNLSVQSCEGMSASFAQNGFGALINESTYYDFSSSLLSDPKKENTDIVKKMNEKGSSKGEAGVPKLAGGNCGNKATNPCKPVDDVVNSGINISFKESLARPTPTAGSVSWIKNVFSSPKEAKDWILKTLGTVQYGTCKKCTQYSESVGTGVYDDIAIEARNISQALFEIVDSGKVPNRSQLSSVSVNDMFVDENVIYALRDETIHRAVFISRIADDLALMKVVDKLLAARRIMIAGKSDPHFQSVTMNRDIINEKLSFISDEIRMLKEELDLKASAKGDVIVRLLDRYSTRRNTDVDQRNNNSDRKIVEGIERITGKQGS